MFPQPSLAALYARRRKALEAIRRLLSRAIKTLSPSERATANAASNDFQEADSAITAYLRTRPTPVSIGPFDLHLTSDRLNFAEVRPGGELAIKFKCDRRARGETILYRYPNRTERTPACAS